MICPNCDEEMQDKSYSYHSMADWDSDDLSYHEECYCSHCKIKYEYEEWHIPSELKITNKQEKTVSFICYCLNLDPPLPVKSKTWKFINKYLSDAIDAKKVIDENREWEDYCFPEYF